ncbi:hypothetical protein RJ639_004808 [Escallonia herrerae]|uniref:cytokinin dehydrogenase n=1 Tax=Escallonia herrerae TaxID=1293975 RepID=A0AA89AY35_9ASTE|nr:hypothetical protein RJ639_004808 [Escallonia herrerae]
MATKLVSLFAICRLIMTVGLTLDPAELLRVGMDGQGQLSVDASEVETASVDFGGMKRAKPLAVYLPGSAEDIARLVQAAYESAHGFTVSARGHGHSINGQAQTSNGVVVQMSSSEGTRLGSGKPAGPRVYDKLMYVDVWGGELWIDVLKSTLKHGLAPKSWTDYLYLSVGGTLSNAGISGQAFNHGPQISNVHELDVVTGKGELRTCSERQNPELFHAVLGGLGQFGIITSARIALEPAPQRVRWIRVLYSNFSAFTHDQEYLISLHGQAAALKFDYVEGFVIVDEGLINNWRSSFFSPHNPVKISSLGADGNGGVLYCLEITKNYDDSNADTIDQEVEDLLKKLNYIPASVFTTDLPYVDFLDRVHKAELKLRSKGLWDVPHPWLNLFVPKSRISDFDEGVFKGILGNKTSGPILIYPMNKNKMAHSHLLKDQIFVTVKAKSDGIDGPRGKILVSGDHPTGPIDGMVALCPLLQRTVIPKEHMPWDERSSTVTPDEDVFYLVALLRSALENGEETQTLEYLSNQNHQILRFCDEAGIGIKQYLPHYTTQKEWMDHFGEKWSKFYTRKMDFDPRHILATGQRIFKPSFNHQTDSS